MSQESLWNVSVFEDTFNVSNDGESEKLRMKQSRNELRQNSSTQVFLGHNETFQGKNVCPVEVQYCSTFHNSENSFCDLASIEQQNFTPPSVRFRESSTRVTDPTGDTNQKVPTAQKVNRDDSGWDHDANQTLRKRYNPRTSFVTTGYKQQFCEKKTDNFERGENPEETVHIELNEKYPHKEGHEKPPHVKNYIVDYGNLRRSGYFLSCQKKDSTPKLLNDNLNSVTFKTENLEKWLNCLPDDSTHLTDSDDDLMDEEEIGNVTTSSFYSPTSDEENFKRLLLNNMNLMKYTSKPVPTLTYAELESILETANAVVDDQLEKLHKATGNTEYEYVSGIIEMPKKEDDNQKVELSDSNSPSGDSWLGRIMHWASSILHNEEEGHLNSDTYTAVDRKVILEPYHGPVAMNGAIIESGSAKLVLRKGIFGSVMEEVKAALQAISEALRRVSSSVAGPPQMFPQESYDKEDPEIARLTEMIQNKECPKKPTLRTVFGLKNADKIPAYSLIIRRRRVQQTRPGFFRAVNGWIQRKANNRPAHRQRFRLLGNQAHLNQVPIQASVNSQQRTDRSTGQDPDSGRVFTGIMSTLRSIVPFQLTPAIPASAAYDQRNNEPVERSRGSGHENPLVIPTRYQILRNPAGRNNTKSKSKKFRSIHMGAHV